MAFGGHAANRGQNHLIHDALMNALGDHRRRRVGAHAAGVGPGIAVAGALVILAGGHRQHVLAIDHDDEAGLLALEEILDHDPRSGIAEGVVLEHVTDRRFGLGFGHRHDHALARGQPVGLDHDRRALLPEVGQRGFDLAERLVVGGRNRVACQEVLGECLGALELRGALGRAEDGQPRCLERVDDAGDERRFRPDDRQIDGVVTREDDQRFAVQDIDGNVGQPRLPRGAGIARCHENRLDLR